MLNKKRYILPVMVLMCPVIILLAFIRHAVSFLFRALKPKNYPPVLRTPEEAFAGLGSLGYTFTPNFIELCGGNLHLPRVHYVDEGPKTSSKVILLIHGEPTWSFLYRYMIKALAGNGYRVIALDFIGFGKSDKYSTMDMYTHDLHTLTLRLFIEHLKLSNITLVVHDWGGPVGLSVVKQVPELIDNLCILNTVLPCRDDTILKHIVNMFHFLFWSAIIFVCQTHLPLGYLLSYAGIDYTTSKGYTAPFPNYRYKAGVARWPQLVPMLPWGNKRIIEDMRSTKRFLRTWTKPVVLMFSDDALSGKGASKELFKSLFPHAEDIPIKGGGYLYQEFKGEELADNLTRFLRKNSVGRKTSIGRKNSIVK